MGCRCTLPTWLLPIITLLIIFFVSYQYIRLMYSAIFYFPNTPIIPELIIFIFLACYVLTCFYLSIKVGPGKVPVPTGGSSVNWIHPNLKKKSIYVLPNHMTFDSKANGCKRFCRKCLLFKPDRTHHCYDCGRCALRLDHHCAFIGVCIGQRNQKLFFQFLFSIIIMGVHVAISIYNCIPGAFLKSGMPLALLLVGITFSGAILIFTFTHIIMVYQGYSSLEYVEKRNKIINGQPYQHPYKGGFRNFIQIFGTNPLLWFIPSSLSNSEDYIPCERYSNFDRNKIQ